MQGQPPSGPPLPLGTNERPDRSENGPYNNNSSFEAIKLDPGTPDTLPRVPLLSDGKVPLPIEGRWVRVETPEGPVAMRRVNPSGPPGPPPGPPPEPSQPVWYDDVWEDEYWDEDWDDDYP
jgi:hypothetical protein